MRKMLFLILLPFLSTALQAQQMERLFMLAPDTVLPLLTENDRFELVEYAKARMKSRVSNQLDGESVLKEITPDYLLLCPTKLSTMQMKLLPTSNDTIICVVNSVKIEAEDSRVAFFDSRWNRLHDDSCFTFPPIKEFFSPSDTIDKYVNMCDIYLVSLRLSPDENHIVAEYTMPSYMNKRDAAVVAPLLRKLVYRWNGKSFVRE